MSEIYEQLAQASSIFCFGGGGGGSTGESGQESFNLLRVLLMTNGDGVINPELYPMLTVVTVAACMLTPMDVERRLTW